MGQKYSLTDEIKRRNERPYSDKNVIEAYSWIHNIVEVGTVINHLNCGLNDLVLDAGCGAGRYSLRLARSCTVIAIDFSARSLKLLKENAKNEGLSLFTVLSDIRYLPLRSDLVDKIVCTEVIQHVPNWRDRMRVVKDLKRVLKNKGKIVLLVYSYRRKLIRRRSFKSGFGGTGIFRLNFDLADLIFLVRSGGFSRYELRGSNNIPERIIGHLGRMGVLLEIFVSSLPISVVLGDYLIANCIK